MASENGDPFDSGSPPPFNPADGEGYEDLFITPAPNTTPDTPMPDLQDGFSMPVPVHGDADTMKNITQKSEAETLQQNFEEDNMDLDISKSKAQHPIEEAALTVSEKSDRIISLLNNNPENEEAPIADPEKAKHANHSDTGTDNTDVAIKKEAPDVEFVWDRFIPAEVIELSDTEDVEPKIKDDIYGFTWASKPDDDDTISISDSDDEQGEYVVLEDGTKMPLKKENLEVEFLWDDMGKRVIELDSDEEQSNATGPRLGKSLLGRSKPKVRHTPTQIAKMHQAQDLLRERIRLQNLNAGPVGSSKAPQAPVPRNLPRPAVEDEHAWMSSTDFTPDENAVAKFKDLKKSYSKKVKRQANTLDDDIEYKRAEREENLRLARLKAEYEDAVGYNDGRDSNDSGDYDESLFMSQLPESRNSKRQRDADDDAEAGNGESPSSRKMCKSNRNRKRTQKDLDKEAEINMMAGIEGFLRKLNKPANEGGDTASNLSNKSRGKGKASQGKKSGQKAGSKRTKRKPNQAGYLNDSASLLTSNVYEDANANLHRDALPVSTEMNKQKALAALVASVPLEYQREARSEKEHIKRATIDLGSNKVKADGKGNWAFKGLKPGSALRHHQVQGAAFMKNREKGTEEPLGGILADSMGLGKTLMTLALMIANPPDEYEKERCTLIVCPPGLLSQWEREIDKHTEPDVFPNVLKHQAATRLSGKGGVLVMQQADIVLTTYQEVIKSYPKVEVPHDLTDEDAVIEWWKKTWDQDRDVLHKVNFYRVVLDESQAIKNHVTQTSIACRALQAKHRWALSGTPIMNRIEELYPYFKFLRAPYTGCYSDFQDNYCILGSSDCNARLHCLLDQIMIRRTFKDTVLGAPIVKLPKHNQRTVHIDFSPVEAAIYRRVFKKFVGLLNKASAEGRLKKHPGIGLASIVAFLRLRQLCAHTFLIQKVLEECLDLDSIDNMEEALITGATVENKNDRLLIASLRRMIEAKIRADEAMPEETQSEQIPTGKIASEFGQYLRTLKGNSNWPELRSRTQCYKCGDPPEEAMVTSCMHVYCRECLESLANAATAMAQDETACLECGTIFTGAESCDGLKELEFDDYWLLNDSADKEKRDGKVNMEWVAYDKKLVLSAKTTAVRDQVEQWLQQEPEKKIIIFSQFHMIMQIMEHICQRRKWKYCTYNGKMTHKARDKAILAFGKDLEMKIMIASLRCGGIGLNLTMASKVICIDPWFNSCMEQQAFCRVFRIGQTSETFITRFIVNKSADEKLVEMQMKKSALISQAMDDKSVMSNLTVEDILRLFGEVKLDRNNKPFVDLEDDEKIDRLFEKGKGKK